MKRGSGILIMLVIVSMLCSCAPKTVTSGFSSSGSSESVHSSASQPAPSHEESRSEPSRFHSSTGSDSQVQESQSIAPSESESMSSSLPNIMDDFAGIELPDHEWE